MATKLSKAKKELKTQSNNEITQLKDQEEKKTDINPADDIQTQYNQTPLNESSKGQVSKESSDDKTVPNSPQTDNIKKETNNEIDIEKDKSKDVSNKSDSQALKTNQNSIQEKRQINLEFYQNKIKSQPQGDFIEVILTKWKGNHKLLESHHGYVQWLFPNYFQSRFNTGASSLSRREAEEFIASKDISNRLERYKFDFAQANQQLFCQRAYDLIYDFFGLKIKDYKTGKVVRSVQYLDRYNKTFITSFHNHMRMSRILCHQNNVGFRKYAIELVDFLEKEIYGQKGYLAYKNDTRTAQEKLKDLTAQSVPLRMLAKLNVFEEWMVYGKINFQDKDQILLIEERCFDSWDNINKESIYFAKL